MKFLLEVFYEYSKKPILSLTCIRVWNPDRDIDKLNVSLDGYGLPVWNSPDKVKFTICIPAHGGANFRVPASQIFSKDAFVVVCNGVRLLRKVRFCELEVGAEEHV